MDDRTRQDEAVELRIAGHTYEEIAERLGYKSRHSAHSVVRSWARRKARAANEILAGGEKVQGSADSRSEAVLRLHTRIH